MNIYQASGVLMSALLFSGITSLNGRNNEAPKHEVQAAGSGIITINVMGSHNWQYEIRPQEGTVTRIREQEKLNGPIAPLKPARAVECIHSPEAMSPDGDLVASCESSRSGIDVFIVTYGSTEKEAFRWTLPKDRSIYGFAWSGDSTSIAVLNQNEYYGKKPLEVLSGLSGHPVPYSDVFVNLFVTEGWKPSEYSIQKKVRYGSSGIVGWKP